MQIRIASKAENMGEKPNPEKHRTNNVIFDKGNER